MPQEEVIKKTIDGRAIITFSSPPHNALSSAMLSQLEAHIRLSGEDPDVRVIVLESQGEKTFCAGANFDELLAIKNEQEGLHFFSGFAGVINSIRSIPKLIIGRVQGKTVGGGVGLAAAVDYCLASKEAHVKLSELSIGIGPFVIEPAITRKVGISAFTELSLKASEFFSSDWALSKGLYHQVAESLPELEEATELMVQRLAAYSPDAQAELKKVLWQGTDHWQELLAERARISGKLVLSEFTKKTLQKFKKK